MREIFLYDICERCQKNSPIWGGLVEDFSVKEKEKSISIKLSMKDIVLPSCVLKAQSEIVSAYVIEKAEINVNYISDEMSERDIDTVKDFLTAKYPSVRSALQSGKLSYSSGKIYIETGADWIFRLDSIKIEMEKELTRWLGKSTAIVLKETAGCGPSFDDIKAEDIKKLENNLKNAPKTSSKPKNNEERNYNNFRKKRDPDAVVFKADPESENIIFGKPVNREITRIGDVSLDGGKLTVKGNIFYRDYKKLNGKGKTSVTFDIYDGTGSIRVNKLFDDDIVDGIKSAIGKAEAVVVQGTAMWSKYENDVIIAPTAIIKEKAEKRKDKADKKRVELHLHTTMSSMDGFCDTKQAINTAVAFGHQALAITDHGVAQAYPDAMNASAGKENFKVIYGIEAYAVNDIDDKGAVKGYSSRTLKDETVVFDLETTGLNAQRCEIIEIAAVIIKDGKEIDEYHSYIKPKVSIPNEITSLTGIDDSTVADARPAEEVIPEFLEFIGDRPVVAHNASFDVGFMHAACDRLGIDREFVSIDTVTIAKTLLTNLKKHRLNNLADYYGLSFNHHRALDDTKVLAQIVFRFWETLEKEYGVRYIDDINGALAKAAKNSGGISRNSYHMVILVKNKKGLRNLYEMISHSYLKYFKRHPLMPMTMIQNMREGLIIGSACEAGELYSAIVRGATWNELVKIASFYDYLEIQPLANNAFMIEKGIVKDFEQIKEFNRTVIKLGEKLNKPVVATGDVHFLEPSDSYFREIMMTGMGFADADKQAPLYFKTTDEMLEEFSYLGKEKAYEVVVENTNMIADMCESIRPVPKEQYPPKIENSARDIEEMCQKRVHEIYGENLPQIVSDRLKLELDSIIGHGFDIMYIIAQKLVSKSIQDGYLVGSRGSVGSSFVAFLTGITEVNALPPHYVCKKCKHSIFDVPPEYACGVDLPDMKCPVCGENMKKDGFDISFATFLGFDGDKTPDIDLNFSGEYQARAHKETINIFGEENVFRAGTIGTIKDKTAYGFVKKYLEQKGLVKNRTEENRLVQGCTGIKRTTGQHPGGLIVVPKEVSIYDFTPVQHPADDPDSDIITTHFDYHSIHDNLLKLDLLGHDDPTMIKVLEDLTGVNAREIPLDDKETMGIFNDISYLKTIDGKSLGKDDEILGTTGAAAIPEFGTKFVRQMLLDTTPSAFEDLCRISGLSHGTNVWLNNAQDIIRAGKGTIKDVVCTRDDILKYLMSIGVENKTAFTIMESVRKGKGLKPEWETIITEHKAHDWYVESCKKIEYLFPRAHAVAYVMMAYRIAWFKVHKPLAFYSAYFSIRAKSFDASVMTYGDDLVLKKMAELDKKDKLSGAEQDMQVTLEICHEFYKRGFKFYPIDIYRSDVDKFLIESDGLVVPFTALPGVGKTAAEDLVANRGGEKFMSGEDIILRCPKVGKSVVDTLDKVGALGDIPKTNQISLF